ncbi:MAG: hypothetical protein HYZ53_10080 [Planctomycetes bacterium]|nr:hypothetical protein [Planctomycetota bacterium]
MPPIEDETRADCGPPASPATVPCGPPGPADLTVRLESPSPVAAPPPLLPAPAAVAASAPCDTLPARQFGALAVRLGLARAADVARARHEQARRASAGKSAPRLGDLLVELGAMSASAVQKVLAAQRADGTEPSPSLPAGSSAGAPPHEGAWRRSPATIAGAVVVAALLGWTGLRAWRGHVERLHALAAEQARAAADRARERAQFERTRLAEEARLALRALARKGLEGIYLARQARGTGTAAESEAARGAAAGDLAAVRASARRAEDLDPDSPEPHYLVGRLSRALLHFDDALAEEDRALAKSPSYAPSLYERAILLCVRYTMRVSALREHWLRREGERLTSAGLLARGGLPRGALNPLPADDALAAADERAVQISRSIREDLEALVRAAGDAETGGAATPTPTPQPGSGGAVVTRAMLRCARGLYLAHVSTRDEDRRAAWELLEAAVAADPTLLEAYDGLARVELGYGKHRSAVAAYARGLEVDRGYVPYLIARARLWASGARDEAVLGSPREECRRNAEADYSKALEVDPACAEAWEGRGGLFLNRGLRLSGRGEDPTEWYARAEHDLGRALELDPASAGGWIARGTLRLNASEAREARGEDPRESYAGAEADFTKAVVLDPESAEAWARRGGLRSNWALEEHFHGRSPEDLAARAVEDYGNALRLDPSASEAWMGRGMLHVNRGTWKLLRGKDPGPDFSQAAADLGKAVELEPALARGWVNLGNLRMNWGQSKVMRGQDPRELFEKAERDYGRALELQAEDADAWMRRGSLRAALARALSERGLPLGDLEERAAADLTKAVELNPSAGEAWQRRGELAASRGGRAAEAGDRAGAGAEEGGEAFETFYKAAEADYGRALERNPRSAEAWSRRGALYHAWGFQTLERGGDPTGLFAEGEADLTRALAIDPSRGDALLARGDLRRERAVYRRTHGEDGAEELTRALADLDEAVRLNPGNAEARMRRGFVQQAAERWAEAVKDLETALWIHPALSSRIEQRLAECRLRARGRAGADGGGAGPEAGAGGEAWRTAFERGAAAINAGDYAAAGPAFEEGLLARDVALRSLPDAERERAAAEPAAREAVLLAHYNLACVLSLRSAGKQSPVAAPVAVAAALAASLRDEAFEHLREAVRLGWTDAQHLRDDADLAPLHADPRWAALVESVAGGKKD